MTMRNLLVNTGLGRTLLALGCLLLALSGNSPSWQGSSTGYASYRSQVWGRWPSAGPTAPFGDAAGYRAVIDDLLRSGAILDEGMVYFDARLSSRYPTVEVRCADGQLRVKGFLRRGGVYVSGSATPQTVPDANLASSLMAFSRARYGRAEKFDGSTLDEALDTAIAAARRAASEHSFISDLFKRKARA